MAQGSMPSAVENRPVLLPGLDFYFTAYKELRYDCPIGMEIGPIPWSSIQKWGEVHYIRSPDDLAILESHIRSLERADREFDTKQSKEAKR